MLLERFPTATRRPGNDHEAVQIPAADLPALLACCRDSLGFDLLSDVTAIDNGVAATPRFTVVWHLLNTGTGQRLRVASDCPDNAHPAMPTATALWPAANCHEREIYDLFGITFTGHPDLRRILMWDGYPYHPLRKDFPLAGLPADLPDPEVAEITGARVRPADMVGGPFVATPGTGNTVEAEPRSKQQGA
ncbi:MAG: NADH-quinone oxidoreductase subunit C [Opitutaceae bacterium]|jgi:NADH-quinone oxidoreductase subunit C|nr:NADH-quinone oxidoreductase subunit C [Opitutaceae bacterium]